MLQPRSVLVDPMPTFAQCVRRLGMVMSAVFNFSRIRAKISIALILLISSATAVAGTFTVHGPQVFVRADGQPVTEVVNFNVMDPTAEYTIIVTNGGLEDDDNTGEKVSSGEVLVNGIQILGPSDFGQNVTQVIRPVTLLGANTLSVELHGKPGGAIAVEIVGIDDVAPTITAAAQPSPNEAGWNNGTVIVTFDCSDDTSGIQSCPDPIVVGVDGANQVISGTATDRAGNTETASVTLNIDTTQPAIDFSLTPVVNAQGWHNADTTVSFVCTDALSGIFSCSDPVSIVTEGANQEATGTAIDVADNTATAVATVSLDKTNPTISASAEPPANANGWNNSDVTVSFACSDALSGVGSCTAPVSVTAEGENQAIDGSGTDIAGNAVATSISISIDKTAPSLTIVSPTAGSTVNSTLPIISVAYSDNFQIDVASLVITANGSPLPVTCQNNPGSSDCTPTTALPEGAITLAASISDNAGNSADAQVSFEISIDEDGDGVSDALDQCPNTPSGEAVDASGCSPSQLDADGDGVTDALDRCPNTPIDEIADATGCSPSQTSVDTDGDGVADAVDECPNTAPGDQVDDAGCSAFQFDADGDGVSNPLDRCPETPANETVDLDGCSPAQDAADADDDGVTDSLDQCLNTPAGAAVDADGCAISQFDEDSDGVADAFDLCAGTPAGEVVDIDGCASSQLDTQAPNLAITAPIDGASIAIARPTIDVTYSDSSGIDENSLTFSLNAATVSTSCVTDQNGAICTVNEDFPDGAVTITASVSDTKGNIALTDIQVNIDGSSVDLSISSPTNGLITVDGSIAVIGLTEPDVTSVKVNDIDATLINGSFSVNVPLREGKNMLVAIATKDNGKTAVRSVDITRDIVAPIVKIDSPRDGVNSVDDLIAVTGLVNDIVNGGIDARVFVNGIEATVSDGTFMIVDLPLIRGPNIIEAIATDSVGNQSSDVITVNFDAITGKRITVFSGNGQADLTNQVLPQPLVIEVKDDLGNPVAGSLVKFEVSRNSGVIRTAPGAVGERVIQIPTNGSGQASVLFELGDTSGEGNNRITVTSLGVAGEAEFCASALASDATEIQMVDGDNQRGIIAQPLARPLEAMVIDKDGNPIKNLPVTFTVQNGGGNLDGQPSVSRLTGTDGIARAVFTLGPNPGINNNLARATFSGATTLSAAYLASGVTSGDPAATQFSGVVLDSSHTAIPGALVTIVNSVASAVTDAEGQFLLNNVPVGAIHLHIDPTGSPRPETFPPLEFETITIAGQVNILGQPIILPAIQMQNAKIVGGAEDVTIFMPDVEGMSLTVKAGSATFPNGDSTGQLSISQVHLDKVPMPPPNGSLFMPPAWTIQPAGVVFDPPAQITIPNDGLPPGRIIDIFQFDHALNQFINVGKGIVADDGFDIVSDNGFGITRTGWGGCGLPPPPDTCVLEGCAALNPNFCQKTQTPACPKCPFLVPVDPPPQLPDDCKMFSCEEGEQPAPGEAPFCSINKCLETDPVACKCTTIEDCDCNDQPDPICNFCEQPTDNNCLCESNPATDNKQIDDCRACSGGQIVIDNGSCKSTICSDAGSCNSAGQCIRQDKRRGAPIANRSCIVCDGDGGVMPSGTCTPEEEEEEGPPPEPDPDEPLPDVAPPDEPEEGIVAIPIEVRHTIPLDFAPLTGGGATLESIIRGTPAWLALSPQGNTYFSQTILPGEEHQTLFMRDIVFTGDNRAFATPSEVDSQGLTFRARSKILVLFDKATKTFSFGNPEEEMRIAGTGASYEIKTSLSDPNDPFSPPFCFRKLSAIQGGRCLTQEARADTVDNVPLNIQAEQDGRARFLPVNTPRKIFPLIKQFPLDTFDFVDSLFIPTGPVDSGIAVVKLVMVNELPLIEGAVFGMTAADVDWTFYLVIDMRNTNAPRFLLQGIHDRFPLFEVYVGEQFIYGYDGLVNGFGGLDLIGPGRNIRNLPGGSGPTAGALTDLREQQ